jgi:hypothetical protein
MHACTKCSAEFKVTDGDLKFYKDVGPTIGGKKFEIPPPTLCPACRMQRRISFRNFFYLTHRTCDLSGKQTISMYDASAPFPVYELHEWWSDKWSAFDYGQEPDFNKSVFEQITELFHKVPRMSLYNVQCENCDYCNFSFNSTNSYLVGGNVDNEDTCYGHIVWQSKDCMDNLYLYRSQRCYECIDCVNSYELAFSRACENCNTSRFLVHCTGCNDCFGCVGLKNKQYCFFNEQLTKEQYESRLEEFNSGSFKMIQLAQQKVQQLIGKEIVKYYHGINCEDITGDYLYGCKNTYDSYDSKNAEYSKYLATTESLAITGNAVLFTHNSVGCANVLYCENCTNCKDCFGCQGLNAQQYCVFNKQYSKEDYEITVQKLIEHMQQTGEWGEYFPVSLTPFGYNQTMAYEYFPLTKQQATAGGWLWSEEMNDETQYMGPIHELPDDIIEAADDICDQILKCDISGKPYKIIPQELTFLRSMHLPLPRVSFLERHKRRMALRNPRKLVKRQCAKCSKDIQTTYSAKRPETVYCETCYLSAVY